MDSRTERQKFDDIVEEKYKYSDAPIQHIEFTLDDMFEVWQAAKHDAKPIVEICTMKYSDKTHHFILTSPDKARVFTSLEDCQSWAVDNGYRLE